MYSGYVSFLAGGKERRRPSDVLLKHSQCPLPWGWYAIDLDILMFNWFYQRNTTIRWFQLQSTLFDRSGYAYVCQMHKKSRLTSIFATVLHVCSFVGTAIVLFLNTIATTITFWNPWDFSSKLKYIAIHPMEILMHWNGICLCEQSVA